MTTLTTETDVLFFKPKYINDVWLTTSDDMLRSALQRRDVTEIEARFIWQLMHRPHHDNARRLLKIRKQYDEFREVLRKFAQK
jgi:hypothetical protein